jgi:hypothetical protein
MKIEHVSRNPDDPSELLDQMVRRSITPIVFQRAEVRLISYYSIGSDQVSDDVRLRQVRLFPRFG